MREAVDNLEVSFTPLVEYVLKHTKYQLILIYIKSHTTARLVHKANSLNIVFSCRNHEHCFLGHVHPLVQGAASALGKGATLPMRLSIG